MNAQQFNQALAAITNNALQAGTDPATLMGLMQLQAQALGNLILKKCEVQNESGIVVPPAGSRLPNGK